MIVRVAAVKVPHIPLHTIRTRAIATGVIDIGTKEPVKGVFFERTDCFAEQPCTDEQEEVGHNNQEDCQG